MIKRFRFIVFFAALLWGIALIQILVTRLFVANTGFTQAFARNQITILSDDTLLQNQDMRNSKKGNICAVGSMDGQLKEEEKEKIAKKLFATLGGGIIMAGNESVFSDYYVAYGYTNGIAGSKKINGHRININVAMSYDEKSNKTKIIMGSPIINSDW